MTASRWRSFCRDSDMKRSDPRADQDHAHFFEQDFSPEKQLLQAIRNALALQRKSPGAPIAVETEARYSFTFDPEISHLYITLFQPPLKPLRWGSRKATLSESVAHAAKQLSRRRGVADFAVEDPEKCRIMFEIVTEKSPCDPKRTTALHFGPDRLEPGIHGLMFQYRDKPIIFMPTDAYVHSLMTMKQIYEFLAKRTGLAKHTKDPNERAALVRALDTPFYKIRSLAFMTCGDEVLPLYRGIPVPQPFHPHRLKAAMLHSYGWLVRHMRKDGKFLYYYDGASGSAVDFRHPQNPGYYNILRHCGGTITLLRAYEATRSDTYLRHAEASIAFLLPHLREHRVDGAYACYPFYNRKSKLGGAGVALVSLILHHLMTGRTTHQTSIEGLVRHILSRIDKSGEMIGYFIHPQFNGGSPITDADDATKRELFSFYYPGEALLGLALYYRHMPSDDDDLKRRVLSGAKKAMNFLIYERPKRYKELFLPLPADAWLMQAVEEWIKVDTMQNPAYADFVFRDADAMLAHMYRRDNSPYFDYVGGFFYAYGDHVLPDGSRCEGLVAAYKVAEQLGRDEKMKRYRNAMCDAAHNLLYTYNSPESTYAHKAPEQSIGAFRFKLTRQWMRVDSVQHTACFYARLLPIIAAENPGRGKPAASAPRTPAKGASQSGMHYLRRFDKAQLFRLFVDGRYQKKYGGWVGYETNERGSVPAMLNGFAFMVDCFYSSAKLSASYLRELHSVCLLHVETHNPKTSPGDLRYLEAGMRFFAQNTTCEHIDEVLRMRERDGTAIFHSNSRFGAGKGADMLRTDEICRALQQHGRLIYRCWYPNLDSRSREALEGRHSLTAFYTAKHYVQMMMAEKMEAVVERYNINIEYAQERDDILRAIALLIRELELLHPFPDGNCRVFACVLLTQLLLYHGFPPALLINPNLDGLLSLKQWTAEIELGMERTLALLEDPELPLFGFSISAMSDADRKRFLETASDLIRKIDRYREIFLDSEKAAACTRGRWKNLHARTRFGGIGTKGTYAAGDLYFAVTVDEWIAMGLRVETELAKRIDAGVAAIVIDREVHTLHLDAPFLIVDDAMQALEACASAARHGVNPRTVLITGTEGKTGAKIQLHHLLAPQSRVHAFLNSANTEVPILRTLSEIRSDTDVELVEFSVDAHVDKTVHRARIVSPDLCLFTNINAEHMHNHKTIQRLVDNKAAVVEGLRPGGVCLLNAAMETYDALAAALKARRSDIVIRTYGTDPQDDATLKRAVFDTQRLGWHVEASIASADVAYFIPMAQSHAPLMSVGTLLAVHLLGFDVTAAAARYAHLKPFESMGLLHRIKRRGGEVLFYDQSRRASISGVRSAFRDLENFKVPGNVVAVLGSISSVKDNEWTRRYHAELADLVNRSSIDLLYTTGPNMQYLHERLDDPERLVMHSDDLDAIYADLNRTLAAGDLLYIQGYMRLGLDRITRKLLEKTPSAPFFETCEAHHIEGDALEHYKRLMVLRDALKHTPLPILQERYEIDGNYLPRLRAHGFTYRQIRADILYRFFERLDVLLGSDPSLTCVNAMLIEHETYVYSRGQCYHWFNNADKVAGEPTGALFGTFFDYGDPRYLFHAVVGRMNLHIGFVRYARHDDGIAFVPAESDDLHAVAVRYGDRLPERFTFKSRAWKTRAMTCDCGKCIDLFNPRSFMRLYAFEKSDLYTDLVKPLLALLKRQENGHD
jgi:UDP-N-acetylmuramyl pentapeptide synthase